MAKKSTKAKPAKLCRIFGVGAQGPLAGAFPDRVVFSFDGDGEVLGFVECAAIAPSGLGSWIPTTTTSAAKKSIIEEYGKRWKKLVVE